MCLLRHPEVATRDCAQCQRWQYDDKGKIAERDGRPLKRIGKAPCHTCPKKSPEQAHLYELSDRNKLAVEFYFTTRAMSGLNLTDDMRQDAIVQRNLAIIDRIIRPYEAERSALVAIAPLINSAAAAPRRPKREGRK